MTQYVMALHREVDVDFPAFVKQSINRAGREVREALDYRPVRRAVKNVIDDRRHKQKQDLELEIAVRRIIRDHPGDTVIDLTDKAAAPQELQRR